MTTRSNSLSLRLRAAAPDDLSGRAESASVRARPTQQPATVGKDHSIPNRAVRSPKAPSEACLSWICGGPNWVGTMPAIARAECHRIEPGEPGREGKQRDQGQTPKEFECGPPPAARARSGAERRAETAP